VRQRDFGLQFKAEDVTESGSFIAYAAAFGNVDQGGDVIAPGAFAKSIQQANREKRLIPMLWQHKRDEPIGKWTSLAEDEHGLRVEGKLHIEFDPLAVRAHGHLKAQSVGGFSIGYNLVEGGYGLHPDFDEDNRSDRAPTWLLTELDLRETSIVTMPMNLEARLVSVKSVIEAGGMPTVRDFEYLMREVCGFSKSKAAAIAGLAKPLLMRGDPVQQGSDPAANDFLAKLKASLGGEASV
jgi:uncharacterized protein